MMAPAIFVIAVVVVIAATFCMPHVWGKVVGFLVTLGLMAALWQVSLGRPRPAIMSPPMGVVTGFMLDEPNAIYLWIVPKGQTVPIAYKMPWSEKQADELVRAARRAKRYGTLLRIGTSTSAGSAQGHGKMKFYSTGTAPLPPKHGEAG